MFKAQLGSGNNKQKIKEFLLTLLYAVLITSAFRSFVYDPFHVPSGSMMPTLIAGDKIFANKYRYGYSKYSFPFKIIPIEGRIFANKLPQRGDVVIFTLPKKDSIYYVKRIIGLPGEKISVHSDFPIVNGKELAHKMVSIIQVAEEDVKVYQFLETNLEGKSYNIYRPSEPLDGSNMQSIKVPDGHYFVMGDNRGNSIDSRFDDVGFIPLINIVGRADAIFFSSPHHPLLTLLMPWTMRGGRFFKTLVPYKQ